MMISIIIPVYNGERYIAMSIQSALQQTYSDIEVIVVNDGSTDSTLDIINSLAESDKRIRAINQSNGGVNAARQAGIQASCGEWICFLDADDTLPGDALSRYSDHFVENPEIIVSGVEGQLDRKGLLLGLLDLKIRPELWAKLFSARLIKEHFPQLPGSIKMGEDLMQNLVMGKSVERISTVSDILYNINLNNPDSVTKVFKSTFEYETAYFHLLDDLFLRHCQDLAYYNELQTAVFKLKINGFKKVALCGNKMDTDSAEWQEVEIFFADKRSVLGPSEKLLLKLKKQQFLYRVIMKLYLSVRH